MSVRLNETEAKLAAEYLHGAGDNDERALLAAKLSHGILELSEREAKLLMSALEVARQGSDPYFAAQDVTLANLQRKLETP